MNTIFEYTRIEFKKSLKVFQKSIISMLLVLFILTIGVVGFSYTLLQNQVFQLVKVAVVIPDSEQQSKLVLQFISGMESVRSICEFEYLDEKTAFNEMKEGEVQAIILLPVNFYNDIYYGENTPLTIYFPKERELNQQLFLELLTSGMTLLQISEAGVYSTQYLAYEQGLDIDRGELGEVVALKFAKKILNRGAIYEAQVLSPLGGVDFVQYYFSVAMLFVMFFSGILWGFLYRKETKTVEQKLRLYGLNSLAVSFVKLLVMTVFLWIVELIFMIGGQLLSQRDAYEALGCSATDFLIKSLWGVLLAISIATYFHMVYSIGKNYQQGTIFLLVSNILLFVGSGLLIPRAYLPEVMQRISVLSPLTLLNRFQLDYLFGQISFSITALVILLIMIISVVGVFFSWKNA